MNRLFPTLLTAAALALLGAGTASANVPMKVVLDAPSTFLLEDEEWSGFEKQKWNLAGTTVGTLGAGNGVFNYKYVRCVGGEVRGELFIDGYRWSNTNTATITAHIDLYEGASCGTADLDGQTEFFTFTLTPGGYGRMLYLTAKNEDEDAEDAAEIMAQIRALPL
jgi:hypothetical protein